MKFTLDLEVDTDRLKTQNPFSGEDVEKLLLDELMFLRGAGITVLGLTPTSASSPDPVPGADPQPQTDPQPQPRAHAELSEEEQKRHRILQMALENRQRLKR